MSNRLAFETSPYLRQHADNPVDWYPWGPEALERARRERKPIFLSIGYSACHWCHVMEHESFEDPETAALLNEHFISIKVDREERPDLDQIYMSAVVALTGQGGWPMSVFLTPEGRPFFGGTYFPPVDRYNLPSFKRLLQGLAQAWLSRRTEVEASSEQITAHLQEQSRVTPSRDMPDASLIRHAVRALGRAFDSAHGGFGGAPKFPRPLELKVLLRAWRRFGDEGALEMARKTLDHMARGGIYDHLGGGFHRYSTDARWLVPHFEKMLYDNALLPPVYLEAYQATGERYFLETVRETLAWVEREMTSADGAFFSTLDADSEGEEGKFYVWSEPEIARELGSEAELFATIFDVTAAGNWEGHNILNLGRPLAQEARLLGIDEQELHSRLTAAKRRLLEVRSRRVRPGRDEKYITAWNGLMIAAFAQAAQVVDGRYAGPAARAADFVLDQMRDKKGGLLRTAGVGAPAKLPAYLEDYACMVDALTSLYEATFAPRWLAAAVELADRMIQGFWDEQEGGFFFVGNDHEPLILRAKEPQDSSTPSGNAVAATALLRLAQLTGRFDFRDRAERTLRLCKDLMAASPPSFGQMLVALDFYLGPVEEFALVGRSDDPMLAQALQLIHSRFRPNQVVACKLLDAPAAGNQDLPLLAGRTSPDGRVTTYLCEDTRCQAPLIGLEALSQALSREPKG